VIAFLLAGCAQQDTIDPRPLAVLASREEISRPPAVRSRELTFKDVTAASGIRFRHTTGAFGEKWFPETNGSGAAFFDYDGDGDADLYLVNGRHWSAAERREGKVPGKLAGGAVTGRLYRNRGDGTFEDVTRGSGLDVEIYGMGAAAGDYDNDGHVDLYVTGIGRNYLFRNAGNGRFHEVARAAGVSDRGWSSSAAWVDVDRDGDLDLFVCHYVRWSPAGDIPCESNKRHVYCGPNLYAPEACRLFRNDGDGRFIDVTEQAGIRRGTDGKALPSKALGVAICDANGDGWPDLAVANDTERNFLFLNRGDGTFREEGMAAGVALPENGEARSGMGIDAGDWDGSGRESLLIGNFPEEMMGLYRSDADGIFADVADKVGVAKASYPFTTFGCLWVDLDNDGWLDIAAANGHIDATSGGRVAYPHAQRPLFLRNEEGRRFRQIDPFTRALVGRGLAAADVDRDGDLDLLLTVNGGAPLLLRNDGGNRGGSIRVTLEGSTSNRSAIGAEVTAWVGRRALRRRVRSGSSYLSQSELPLTLGLGAAAAVDRLEITWPSGATQTLTGIPAGQALTVRERG
jgi:hypothetical protein